MRDAERCDEELGRQPRRTPPRGCTARRRSRSCSDLVAGAERVRPLGTRHSFTDVADTTGDLVSTQDLAGEIEIDTRPAPWCGSPAGSGYGDLAATSGRSGWALATMASLPHISVAGAIATGTHGSGDRTGSLAAAVAGLELVAADGELRTRRARATPTSTATSSRSARSASTTHVTLDIEPTYDVRQDLYTDLPWDVAVEHLDELTAQRLQRQPLHRLAQRPVDQVWLKSRDTDAAGRPVGRRPGDRDPAHARRCRHRRGHPAGRRRRAVEPPAPALPDGVHARAAARSCRASTSSRAPRRRRRSGGCAALAPSFDGLLQVTEVRTIAADELWLSGAYGGDVVGLHFTWVRDVPGVYAVLPAIEDALLPLGGRPHWGKCFAGGRGPRCGRLYPRFDDFRALADRVDPSAQVPQRVPRARISGLARGSARRV